MLFKEEINCSLEHKGIVDGNHADLGLAIPTWLSSPGDWTIHDIVRDKEERLQLQFSSPPRKIYQFDGPAENSCF